MGDRFLALVLDTLLFVAVCAAAGMAVARRFGGITEQGFSFEGKPALLTIGITLLIAFLYYWFCEGLFGATLGKGMIGIRVRMKDGRACGLSPSLIRNLLRLIDGIAVYLVGFLVAIMSRQRQRLGDHIAGTIVVETKVGGVARSALVISWLLLLASGFVVAYKLHRGMPVTAVVSDGGRTEPEPSPARTAATGLPSIDFSSTRDLKATNVDCLQSEDGPSRPPAPYAPGDKVYLKYDVAGYSTDPEGRARLLYNITASDPDGLPMHAPWKDQYTGRLERGSPVHGTFNLGIPRSGPGGTSKIVVTVRDELNHDELQFTVLFKVERAPLAPATSLEIRHFEIAASESGPAAAALELQDGSTVYMRCKVFGQQFRGDQADVRMAIKLIGPGGKTAFEEADYGSIRDTYVCHPPRSMCRSLVT